MKKKFSKEVIIGVTVLAALLILFFGINFLKGINLFKPANYYYASYTNVAGLTIASPVKLNGFTVGIVRDMEYEYDNPGHVLVELSLDKKMRIPEGSEALLCVDLLGAASIDLILADNQNFIEIGEKIKGSTPSGLMDAVANDIMPAVGSIMPKIDSLLTSINSIVSDPALKNSVRRLDNITANLEATSQQLTQMSKTLSPAMGNVAVIADNLKGISNNLNDITQELNNAPLDSTLNNLNSVVANAKDLTDKLNGSDSSLGLLLNDTKLHDNINGTVKSLDSLFIDIKKNPKRYINVKLL